MYCSGLTNQTKGLQWRKDIALDVSQELLKSFYASPLLRVSLFDKFCDRRYSCMMLKPASPGSKGPARFDYFIRFFRIAFFFYRLTAFETSSSSFITSSAIEKMLSYKGKVSSLPLLSSTCNQLLCLSDQ
jgi:hypothetical protein